MRLKGVVDSGKQRGMGAAGHDMTAHRCRGDAENDLFGSHFARRKLARLESLTNDSMHGPEAASALHPVLVLANLIGFLPKGMRFQHQFDAEIIRISLREMTAGEADGTGTFPAAALKLECALEEIGALFEGAGDDGQGDVLLGLEMQVKRSFRVLYSRGEFIQI